MKTVILYDSWYGNTERIARAIANEIGGDVELRKARYAAELDYSDVDLLIVGSPTHGGVATPAMNEYLDRLDPHAFEGVPFAAFDTRVGMRWVKLLGFAGRRLTTVLKIRGGEQLEPPIGFYVEGRHGPLKQGEIERAREWARSVKAAFAPDVKPWITPHGRVRHA